MAKQTQGCHKCGGYPGHPSKNRAFLVYCINDGTYTCNNHLTIMGNCPKCGSGKVKKVMTQADIRKSSKGGMPGSKQSHNESQDNNRGGMGSDVDQGGLKVTDSPQSSSGGDRMSITENPGEHAPENIQHIKETILSEITGENNPAEGGYNLILGAPVTEGEAIKGVSLSSYEAISSASGGTSKHSELDNFIDTIGTNETTSTSATNVGSSSFVIEAKGSNDKPAAEDHKIPQNKAAVIDKPSSIEESEDEELDDFFDEIGTKAFDFDNSNDDSSKKPEEEGSDDEEEMSSEDKIQKDPEALTDEELSSIDEEFSTIAKRRQARMENQGSIKRLQEMAKLPLKEIPPSLDYIDSFWGLSSSSLSEEIDRYRKMVDDIKQEQQKNNKAAEFLIGVIGFEPLDDLTLNREIIASIHNMQEVYCIIGFGPKKVKFVKKDELSLRLKSIIGSTDQVIGIGVLGLDMHYAPYTIDQQREVLRVQLNLAAELDVPAYITSEKADAELCSFIEDYMANTKMKHKLIYAGLLNSDEMASLVKKHDMHICLRPELTYPHNLAALERTAKIKPVRWLPCSGMQYSSPVQHGNKWNEVKFIPETMRFLAEAFNKRDNDEFMTLCVGNFARLLFSQPASGETAEKEDIWAGFDKDKPLY